MPDSRELTFGLDFGLDKTIADLEKVKDNLEDIKSNAKQAEDAASDLGTSFRPAVDGADDVKISFKQIGSEAKSLGGAISQSMGTALKSGQSTAKSIQAGFEGAFGYTGKKASDFLKTVKKGASDIGTALRHPISTIKDKLGDALTSAGDDADDLGDKADKARRDLDDMGDEGDSAGSQIKDSIKDAIGAFVGFEAIQAGVDMLKEFASAAMEVTKVAENSGRKFDASFAGTDAGEWVDNYADSVHRSTAEIQSFMVSNKALYSELGVTGDQAAELSKITTSLAYDFGNAFAMDDTEALGVVQDFISGNNAALEEYGVHIDDATLKNTALALGIKGEVEEWDAATAAMVRTNALLENTTNIQGAALNSTDGLTNSMKSMSGIWTEFMADAGTSFAPTLESLFGIILDSWPTIEPMLIGFVEILGEGFQSAAPGLIELGTNLIPTLTSVVGTLFQAVSPLLPVIADLAGTVLPPLANIIGMVAETVLPPLVDTLTVISDSILGPLMPVIESLAGALLPAIGNVLGMIAPILQVISPVLEAIGNVLGFIGDILGTIIGDFTGGISSIVGFFGNLFGGAKESSEEIGNLSGAIDGLDSAASAGSALTLDTSAYREEIQGAAETTTQALADSTSSAADITGQNMSQIQTSSQDTFTAMADGSADAWNQMGSDADAGSSRIVSAFKRIESAARSASSAASINIGSSIPHNARGTDNFQGGLTWMNEEGGELAVLPSGSTIIPADQTDRIMQSYTNSTVNQTNSPTVLSPNIQIYVSGGNGADSAMQIKEQIKALFDELYQEAQEKEYSRRAMQRGYA